MIERELKLHVPVSTRAELVKRLRSAKARRVLLHARYYDTPDRELANAGIALRMRKEGRRWMQTVKAPGPDPVSRVELNHLRPDGNLDLALYDNTPIQTTLSALAHPLALRYETKVVRLLYRHQTNDTIIEIAFDEGALFAGELELPILEVEFELIEGSSAALFDIAKQWTLDFGLILDPRSKAERGDTLAGLALSVQTTQTGETIVTSVSRPNSHHLFKPYRAKPPKLGKKNPVSSAYLSCAHECLTHIVQNAAYTAGVDTALANSGTHMEFVHQLRVGVRRLKSCQKLFEEWVPALPEDALEKLNNTFSQLGARRDLDVLRTVVAPRLKLAGMPDLRMPRANANRTAPASLANSPSFQNALLDILQALVEFGDTIHNDVNVSSEAKKRNSQNLLPRRLSSWLQAIVKKGSKFTRLPIDEQHNVRKDVKRLRYCLEMCAGVLNKSMLSKLRPALETAQEDLGELNDYYTAEVLFQDMTEKQAQAWFAVGWLKAMQAQKQKDAEVHFQVLNKAPRLDGKK
ncbi:MAG: inorganic triphosphatase [Pusillimonas sp.]|jgi:inorganic triphosphatase YgiF|nr:inorganic triphosphatase [Pusillimonas sp.]